MLTELQTRTDEWRRHNFPAATWEDQLIGMMEELGELSHSLLKQKQSIRGNEMMHEMNAKDAIGDLVIFMMGLCSLRGWGLEEIIKATVEHVVARDWITDPIRGEAS